MAAGAWEAAALVAARVRRIGLLGPGPDSAPSRSLLLAAAAAKMSMPSPSSSAKHHMFKAASILSLMACLHVHIRIVSMYVCWHACVTHTHTHTHTHTESQLSGRTYNSDAQSRHLKWRSEASWHRVFLEQHLISQTMMQMQGIS